MITDLFRIDDQVAIITGSGRGIGAASAVALAECGAHVVIASRTASDLDEVAHSVESLDRDQPAACHVLGCRRYRGLRSQQCLPNLNAIPTRALCFRRC